MSRSIEDMFPALQGQSWSITSPPDTRYNCIAWAAEHVSENWWPDAAGEHYWPKGVARVESLDAFRDAFATMGYVVCDHEFAEPGYEKIALFALVGTPTHAARQVTSGRWTSKLGEREDIEHSLHDLTGLLYGSVAVVMKRPLPGVGETTETTHPSLMS